MFRAFFSFMRWSLLGAPFWLVATLVSAQQADRMDAQAKHTVVYEQKGCCGRLEARYLIEGARAKLVSKDLPDALVALVERRKTRIDDDDLIRFRKDGVEPTDQDDPDEGRILIRNKTSGEVWVVGFRDNERSKKIEWLSGAAHSPLKFRKGQYANVVIRQA